MKNLCFKNLIILFFVLIFGAITVYADVDISPQLSKIESELWGIEYESEAPEDRLNRIEREIFGANSPNLNLEKRVDKISKSMGLETIDDAKKAASDLYVMEKAGQGAEYPIVDELETTLLGSVYKTDDINTRLERLENSIFGAKQTGDLSERTDAIRRYASGGNYRNSANSGGSSLYQTYNPTYNPESAETKMQLSALENMIYGTDYSADPVNVRLSRLEAKIFQRDFSDDDLNMRIQRIQAAATAGKTAKYYDNNKFQKFASTGMQIGTFLLMILAFIL